MTDHDPPILPEDWDTLAPLLDQLLDALPEARAALLTTLARDDSRLHAALAQLLADAERETPLLDRPALERFDQLLGDDADAALPDVLGGRYRIERELGHGGMARVYLAEDLKHERHVAVKVIRPELAASLGRERFLREIGIAARLRHPNIMPLFDSGDVDDLLYFVMPYEAGQSLRARITHEGPLRIAEAVSILRDVARALAYAHEHGVVHRDIKPDNVLLAGDAAVVTDFGIAKAVQAAQTESGATAITQTGMVIGTPEYMAPEQGLGDPAADARADIYSFGCLAYEVLTGKPPFVGTSSFQVMAAQMTKAPVPVSERRPDAPANIVALVAKCLERDPAHRPQSAAAILDVLGGASLPQEVPRRRSRRTMVMMMIVPVLILAVAAIWVLRPRSGQIAISVLPLGSDSSRKAIAEGFSGEVFTALGKFPWLRPVSPGGAYNYLGQREVDTRIVGKALGAQYIVSGTMTLVDGREVILVNLFNATDGALVWGQQFDRPDRLDDLRDLVARSIADTLRPEAGSAWRAVTVAAAPKHKGSGEAYDAYVIGRQKLRLRGQNVSESITQFRRAIALDSLLAEAYSGLSMALALEPYFEDVPAPQVADSATKTARIAIRLDSTLSQPHIALGMVLANGYHWQEAEKEFRRAIALDSQDVEARLQYGRYLLQTARDGHDLRAALTQMRAAKALDPASAVVASQLSHTWYLLGQLDSARAEIERARQIDQHNVTTMLFGADVLVAEGRRAEARQLLDAAPNQKQLRERTVGFGILVATGDTLALRSARARADEPQKPWMMESATGFALMSGGDTGRALDLLEHASDSGELWPMLREPLDPLYNAVRQSPRFKALLTRVGLPSPR